MSPEAVEAMVYTEAVVNEGMRSLPQLVGTYKKAQRDFEVNGYRIPKGWTVMTATGITIQYLDDRWPMDADFNPDRYFTKDGVEPAKDLMFGMGPHLCIGRFLSILENTILLATLARGYEIVRLGNDPDVSCAPFPLPEDGLPLKVVRRK